jgi:hypothetical protein
MRTTARWFKGVWYLILVTHGGDGIAGEAMTATIYVYLPREAVDVWAPVDAQHIRDDVYRILDCRGEDDNVQFGKGVLVRCRRQSMSGQFGTMNESLVAFEEAKQSSNSSDNCQDMP